MLVAFHTLGCKVNQYETEAIKAAFVSRGDTIVQEDERADVYVINTCTVTNIADRKSRQYIRRMKSRNPEALIVVTGCYAQVEPDEVSLLPEVDLVVGNGNKTLICGLVYDKLSKKEAPVVKDRYVLPRSKLTYYEDMGLVVSSESGMSRAYIKIQEGCDRFCSYCLIPYARGTMRSRPIDEIIEEVQLVAEKGYKEAVLTGINTALYGTEKDFDRAEEGNKGESSALELLLDRLDKQDNDIRIRLSSLEPTVVDVEDVTRIIKHDKLCRHLHLSVQSGSTPILKAMNRRYTASEYLGIIEAIRKYDPLFGVTTDIIVGFPGETEEDFENTLEVVRKAEFGRVHIFRYSPRKGTVAANLTDAVPENIKKMRAERLATVAERTAQDFYKKNFDIPHTVLIEEKIGKYLTGYTENYIKVYIETSEMNRLAELVRVELTQIYKDGCKAIFI
ncbi:MAG: tRNA (N(6)-L-threonylcarbamoyladenosine(37)-C(2))-methylthiotransferase MtaB [Clostridiales bacterium]|nr:tRNA (N(6)-L-threonylcarbamoyladenosine(37)-C(2))-methylthiotransferase MtaB [Clostridiales bacterium]